MKVKDFDSYRAPNRKPWAAILVLLALGFLIYWFFIRERPPKSEPVDDVVAEETSEPSVAVTPESTGKADEDAAIAAAIPTADVALMMDEASQLAAEDKLVEARQRYLEALKHTSDSAVQLQIERKVAPINVELVTSPRRMPEKQDVLVKSGDSLDRIARRFGTTTELIQKSNLLMNPNLIKVGDRLRVFTGKFQLASSKSRHDLVVTLNGAFFKRYKVGTGRFGKTPIGTFVIRDKIKEPVWWRPDGREVPFGDEENILGTRWFALRATGDTEDVRGYGIHGTWAPESVGSASSAGCLRMINEEVEELFSYIPIGTQVTISE
ncbi:MAG: L,D-transpeptidase family protein [Verrucomicrobia bacterium]|jgi:LysM repeat protein|nr:L,D-transpeptidase family protein [Verrucomicrobiota bacterium]